MSETLKSTGGVTLAQIRGVPVGADPSCWGCKERIPGLTNGEIIFEEFQPM